MSIIVREAARRDAEALIAHIREQAAEREKTTPLEPDEVTISVEDERDWLAGLVAAPKSRMFVAEAEGAVIGEISVRPVSERRALAHVATLGMSVKRPWRRRGVGRALLARAIEFTERAGIRRLELQVYARNTAAIRLYEAFGFVLEGRRRCYICEDGTYLDDLVMARLFGVS